MGRKWLAIAGAVLGVLLLLGISLGFKGWDATEHAGEALARMEKEAGWKLEAESARLVPLKGLELEGVSGTIRVGGTPAEVQAERLVLEHRPSALLGGRLELESLRLVRPTFLLTEPAPRKPTPPPPAAERPKPPPADKRPAPPSKPVIPEPEPYEGPVRFESLRSVLVEDATIAIVQEDGARELQIEGLSLDLQSPKIAPEHRRSLSRALTTEGTFRVARADLPVGSLVEASGPVRIENGELILPELAFENAYGDFVADVSIKLARAPLQYSVGLDASRLDLHALFDSPERELFGGATFEMNVRGNGTTAEGLAGNGRLKVSEGQLPSFPILNHLEASLRRVNLHHAKHGPFEARFLIQDGALELQPFTIQAAELLVTGQGRVGLGGGLDMRLQLMADPSVVSLRGVPDDLVELMKTGPKRLAIPVIVTGTTERPEARADAAALAERSRQRGGDWTESTLRVRLDQLFSLDG